MKITGRTDTALQFWIEEPQDESDVHAADTHADA